MIEPPSGRTVLVDAGSTSLSDLLAKCSGPFLRRRQYTGVDTVLVSHANTDHFNAVADVVGGCARCSSANRSPSPPPATPPPPACRATSTASSARAHDPAWRRPAAQRDTRLEVLWPPKGSLLSPNDTSLVVRLSHAGRSVLFTGDIQDDAMANS